jgi:hypothetical protein
MFPVAQAQRFFIGWHAAQPFESDNGADIARMRAFFDAWKSSVPALATSHPAKAFDCQQFASFAATFSPAYQDYRRTGVRANPWRAAGVDWPSLPPFTPIGPASKPATSVNKKAGSILKSKVRAF